MITFRINDKEVEGEDGWTVLDVARTFGIDIPTLCHYGAVEPAGACRLCSVEVDDGKRRRIVASCLYPIRQGIHVHTDSERVQNVRRWILQMLADEYPGSGKIKELAGSYGIRGSRFRSDDLENTCILCGLCVRTCDEVSGARALSFGNRGIRKEVTTPYRLPNRDCVGCGACLYVCPTESMGRLFERIRLPEASPGLEAAKRRRP